MTHLWTQDAFDCLCIRLSFSHWLSLLFPLVLTVPSILSSLTVREYCPHGFKSPFSVASPCLWLMPIRRPQDSPVLAGNIAFHRKIFYFSRVKCNLRSDSMQEEDSK